MAHSHVWEVKVDANTKAAADAINDLFKKAQTEGKELDFGKYIKESMTSAMKDFGKIKVDEVFDFSGLTTKVEDVLRAFMNKGFISSDEFAKYVGDFTASLNDALKNTQQKLGANGDNHVITNITDDAKKAAQAVDDLSKATNGSFDTSEIEKYKNELSELQSLLASFDKSTVFKGTKAASKNISDDFSDFADNIYQMSQALDSIFNASSSSDLSKILNSRFKYFDGVEEVLSDDTFLNTLNKTIKLGNKIKNSSQYGDYANKIIEDVSEDLNPNGKVNAFSGLDDLVKIVRNEISERIKDFNDKIGDAAKDVEEETPKPKSKPKSPRKKSNTPKSESPDDTSGTSQKNAEAAANEAEELNRLKNARKEANNAGSPTTDNSANLDKEADSAKNDAEAMEKLGDAKKTANDAGSQLNVDQDGITKLQTAVESLVTSFGNLVDAYKVVNRLYANNGDGGFTDITGLVKDKTAVDGEAEAVYEATKKLSSYRDVSGIGFEVNDIGRDVEKIKNKTGVEEIVSDTQAATGSFNELKTSIEAVASAIQELSDAYKTVNLLEFKSPENGQPVSVLGMLKDQLTQDYSNDPTVKSTHDYEIAADVVEKAESKILNSDVNNAYTQLITLTSAVDNLTKSLQPLANFSPDQLTAFIQTLNSADYTNIINLADAMQRLMVILSIDIPDSDKFTKVIDAANKAKKSMSKRQQEALSERTGKDDADYLIRQGVENNLKGYLKNFNLDETQIISSQIEAMTDGTVRWSAKLQDAEKNVHQIVLEAQGLDKIATLSHAETKNKNQDKLSDALREKLNNGTLEQEFKNSLSGLGVDASEYFGTSKLEALKNGTVEWTANLKDVGGIFHDITLSVDSLGQKFTKVKDVIANPKSVAEYNRINNVTPDASKMIDNLTKMQNELSAKLSSGSYLGTVETSVNGINTEITSLISKLQTLKGDATIPQTYEQSFSKIKKDISDAGSQMKRSDSFLGAQDLEKNFDLDKIFKSHLTQLGYDMNDIVGNAVITPLNNGFVKFEANMQDAMGQKSKIATMTKNLTDFTSPQVTNIYDKEADNLIKEITKIKTTLDSNIAEGGYTSDLANGLQDCSDNAQILLDRLEQVKGKVVGKDLKDTVNSFESIANGMNKEADFANSLQGARDFVKNNDVFGMLGNSLSKLGLTGGKIDFNEQIKALKNGFVEVTSFVKDAQENLYKITARTKNGTDWSDVTRQFVSTEQERSVENAVANRNEKVQELLDISDSMSKLSQNDKYTQSIKEQMVAIANEASEIAEKYKDIDPSNLNDLDNALNKVKASQDAVNSSIEDGSGILGKTGTITKYLNQLNKASNTAGISDELKSNIMATISEINSFVGNEGNYTQQLQKTFGDKVQNLLRQVAVETANSSDNMFIKINERMKNNLAGFISQFFSFYDIIRYTKEIASSVMEVDSALIELEKVSDASGSRLQESFKKSADAAQELGATVTDMIDSTSDWSRLGYSLDDAEQLAKVTQLYQNVGDNMTREKASESLISTLQGFHIAADDAESVVDKFNEVANNFAIDTEGIGQALQRSAASFNASGTDLSKSIALITAANTVLQDPESVGTTFKTLSARIRGSKTELEELGEETDKYTETTSNLRGLIKSLTGFDIMKENGKEYKDVYDIVVGIGKQWKNLTDIQQASLGEALAGKRNSNALYAVLDNIDTLQKAYETAENSAGSAEREQQHYAESIEYSLDRVKASAQELATNFMSSDLVKGSLDFFNGLVRAINAVTKSIGSLNSIVLSSGALALIKRLIADKSKGVGALDSIMGIFRGIGSFVKGHPVLAIVQIAASIVTAIVAVKKQAKKAQVELAHDTTTEFDDAKETVNNYISQYQKLHDELEQGTKDGSLSDAQQLDLRKQIFSLESQIKDQYGGQAKGIDLVNGSLDEEIDKLNQILGLQAYQNVGIDSDKLKAYKNAEEEMTKVRDSNIVGISKDINDIDSGTAAFLADMDEDYASQVKQSFVDNLRNAAKKAGFTINDEWGTFDFTGTAQEINDAIVAFENNLTELKNNASSDAEKNFYDVAFGYAADALTENKDVLDNYKSDYISYLEQQVFSDTTLRGLYSDLSTSISDYNEALATGAEDDIEKTQDEFYKIYSQLYDSAGEIKDQYAEYAPFFDDVIAQLDQTRADTYDLKQIYEGNISQNNSYAHKFAGNGIKQSDLLSSYFGFVKKSHVNEESVFDMLTDNKYTGAVESALRSIARLLGYDLADSTGLEDFLNVLGEIIPDFAVVTDEADDASTAISSFASSAERASDAFDKVNTAMSDTNGSRGLTYEWDTENQEFSGTAADIIDAFDTLNDYNPDKLFEKSADGIRVNREELKKYREETKEAVDDQYLEKRAALEKQLADYENNPNSTFQDKTGVRESIRELDLEKAAFDALSSAYQNYKDALEQGEYGDIYDDIKNNVVDNAKSLYSTGKTGTNQFQAIAQLYSYKDLASATQQEIEQAYASGSKAIDKYFTNDNGITEFMDRLVDMDDSIVQVTKDSAGIYHMGNLTKSTVANIAKELGVSTSAVEALIGKIRDYGNEITIFDDDYFEKHTKELTDSANDAVEELKSSISDTTYDGLIDALGFGDLSDFTSSNELTVLLNTLNAWRDVMSNNISIGVNGASERDLETLDALIIDITQRKQDLDDASNPISINTKSLTGVINETQDAIDSIDTIQSAISENLTAKGLTGSWDEENNKFTGTIGNLIDTFDALDDFDASKLFNATANGVRLNTEEFDRLNKELDEKRLSDYQEEISRVGNILRDGTVPISEKKELQEYYNYLQLLVSMLNNATGAYQNWVRARDAGESSQVYKDLQENLVDRAKALYAQGKTNTNEFNAAAQLYSYSDLSDKTDAEIISAYASGAKKVNKYFEDNNGIEEFIDDLVAVDDNVINITKDSEGAYRIADELNDDTYERVAQYYGVSVDLVKALFDKASEYLNGSVIKFDPFEQFISRSQDAISAIDNVNSALAESISGKGLTAEWDDDAQEFTGSIKNIEDAYKDLDDYDPNKLFELTANGIHLNANELRRLQEEADQKQLASYSDTVNELNERLSNASSASEVDAINEQIRAIELQQRAYEGATSAYQKYLDAQSAGEEGNIYDNFQNTIVSRGKSLLGQGLVGTNEFRSIAQLYSNKSLATASVNELVSAYQSGADKINKYFENDAGLKSFLDDLVSMDDEVIKATRDASGAYHIAGFTEDTVKNISNELGVSADAVEAIFKKYQDYGNDISFIDVDAQQEQLDGYNKSIELIAKNISGVIKDNKGKSLIDNAESTDDLDDLQETLDYLTEHEEEIKVNLDDQGIQDFDTLISSVQDKINLLNNSSVDVNINLDSFSSFVEATQTAIDNIDSVNSAMAESVSGKGLTAQWDTETGELTGSIKSIEDAFKGLEGYDPNKLFEKTANGIHVNGEELRKLKKEADEKQLQNYSNTLSSLYSKLEAAKETGDTGQISAIQSQIQQVSLLQTAYEGATSAYQQYLDALNAGEEGDIYTNIQGTVKDRGKELYDQGLVGTNEFRSIAQLYSYDDLSTAPIEDIVAAYEKGTSAINKYFTEDRSGVDAFAQSLVDMDDSIVQATIDGDEFKIEPITEDVTDRIAKTLGVSTDMVESIFKRMIDYGGQVQFLNAQQEEQLKEYNAQVEAAQNALSQYGYGDFNLEDVNDIDELQSKLGELESERATFSVNSDEYKAFSDLITAIQSKIDVLSSSEVEPGVTLDSYNEALSTAQSLQDRIQQIQSAPISLGLTIEGDDEVNALATTIAGLPSEIKVSLGFSENADTTEIIDKIKNKEVTITSDTSGLDEGVNGATNSLDSLDKNKATPTIDANKTSFDSKTNSVRRDLSSINRMRATPTIGLNNQASGVISSIRAAIINLPSSKTITITTVHNVETHKTGGSSASGTAHAMGTAYSKGSNDISVRKDETALTNEVGEEIIVRDGSWFIANNGNPGFTDLKKGDIVFNHTQSEKLLKNGVLRGSRGKIIGDGSAFANGTAKMGAAYAGLGVKFKLGNIGGSGSKSNSSNSSSSAAKSASSAAKTASNATKSASKATKSVADVLDEFEILIDRIERAIDKADTYVQSAYRTFETRFSNLTTEMQKTNEKIADEKAGVTLYQKQADKVNLSSSWKKKVQNGAVRIEDIKDEALKNKIDEYQKWWDKMQDCSKELTELEEKQSELYKTRFDLSKTKFDEITQNLSEFSDMMDNYIDLTKTEGHIISQSYYEQKIGIEQQTIKNLEQERTELINNLNDALKTGNIQKYSEEWYSMQSDINDVNKQLIDAQKNIADFQSEIRQISWDIFDRGMDSIDSFADEMDFLYDMLGDEDDFFNKYKDVNGKTITTGKFNDTGAAGFGLLAMQYDTYLKVAQQDAKELEKINAQIANDPSNTTLLDRRKELVKNQQEYIKNAKDEKDAMVDLVKKGIDNQVDALNNLIDNYEDLLDKSNDFADYARDISDAQKDINDLNKQIMSWQGDTSEEGAANRQKAQSDLRDKQKDFQDKQNDRRTSEIKDLLSSLSAMYENTLNMRLDNIDALIADVVTGVNASGGAIASTIIQEASTWGYGLSSAMTATLDDAKNAVSGTILGTLDPLNASIYGGADHVIEGFGTSITGLVNAMAPTSNLVSTFVNSTFTNTSASVLKDLDGILQYTNSLLTIANQEAAKKIADAQAKKAEQEKQNSAAKTQPAAKKVQGTASSTSSKKSSSSKSSSGGGGGSSSGGGGGSYSGGGGGGLSYSSSSKKKKTSSSKKKTTTKTVFEGYQVRSDGTTNKSGSWKSTSKKKSTSIIGKISNTIKNTASSLLSKAKKKIKGKKASGDRYISNSGLYWTNEGAPETIIRKKDGAILTPLSQGDMVLNNAAHENLWSFANDPEKFMKDLGLSQIKIPANAISSGNNTVEASIMFNLPNVKNYQEFMTQAQSDPKFQKLVQEMTLGSINGNNSYKKRNIKF